MTNTPDQAAYQKPRAYMQYRIRNMPPATKLTESPFFSPSVLAFFRTTLYLCENIINPHKYHMYTPHMYTNTYKQHPYMLYTHTHTHTDNTTHTPTHTRTHSTHLHTHSYIPLNLLLFPTEGHHSSDGGQDLFGYSPS